MTHGAISRQVAAFETWLGVQVFHRRAKRMRLTDDGRRYLALAESEIPVCSPALLQRISMRAAIGG
ncbi:hypothetical protein AYM40_22410 [Paraburkholderia phytofirmans OLGA172]|uniref:HTH lysR-type domain-containing protein n=1 Tax=Paraburkholderia phytofirmans OLGA172 TaxID=1417228 RepID=A0A160FQW4_9BURK|nr:hypothetical protein AYM40_22410 [Paraburkholderia phytofirmans OLGA172]